MATASHACKADLGPPHSSSEKAEPCLPGPSPRRPGAAAAPGRVGGHAPHPPIRGAAADPLKAWGARSHSPPFQPQHISGNVENTPRRRDILELVVGRPRPLPLELGCIISPKQDGTESLETCMPSGKEGGPPCPALPRAGVGWRCGVLAPCSPGKKKEMTNGVYFLCSSHHHGKTVIIMVGTRGSGRRLRDAVVCDILSPCHLTISHREGE